MGLALLLAWGFDVLSALPRLCHGAALSPARSPGAGPGCGAGPGGERSLAQRCAPSPPAALNLALLGPGAGDGGSHPPHPAHPGYSSMSGIPGEESSRGSPCPRLIDGSVLPLQTHAGNCFVRNAWGSHYGRLALTWEVKLMLRHRMLFWVTIILSLELSLSN